jgi:hypothetical protein
MVLRAVQEAHLARHQVSMHGAARLQANEVHI